VRARNLDLELDLVALALAWNWKSKELSRQGVAIAMANSDLRWHPTRLHQTPSPWSRSPKLSDPHLLAEAFALYRVSTHCAAAATGCKQALGSLKHDAPTCC